VTVAIDWIAVQSLMREMLATITGIQPPPVLASAPGSLAAWWADWWATERTEQRWYRGELPAHLVLPESTPRPDFTPQRGRVD